jgi:hypothetical protein
MTWMLHLTFQLRVALGTLENALCLAVNRLGQQSCR